MRNQFYIVNDGKISDLYKPSRNKEVNRLSINETGCAHIINGRIAKRFGKVTITAQSITCRFELIKTNFQLNEGEYVDKSSVSWGYIIDRYSGKALYFNDRTNVGTCTRGIIKEGLSVKSFHVDPYPYSSHDNLEMEFECTALQKKF